MKSMIREAAPPRTHGPTLCGGVHGGKGGRERHGYQNQLSQLSTTSPPPPCKRQGGFLGLSHVAFYVHSSF